MVSLSMAVQVQMSPAPGGAAFALRTFFALAYQKDQISSHWTLAAGTSRTVSSWYLAQVWPASKSSLVTVLIETSSTREMARIDIPSTSNARILARLEVGNLFINRRIQGQPSVVKHYFS